MRVLDGFTRALSVIAGVLLGAVAVGIATDITYRYITNRSLPGIIEYSEVALVAMAYLAFPYAERQMAHIRVDSITGLLPRRVRLVVITIAYVPVIVIIGYFAWVSGVEALHSWEIGEYRLGTVQVPIWPARVIIPISFFLVALQLIATLARKWLTERKDGTARLAGEAA